RDEVDSMSAEARFKWVAYAEGASFLALLGIAMPLKYLAGMPQAVRVVGLAHGVLFLAYVWLIFDALGAKRFGLKQAALAFIAALLPFGPFVFERWRAT
ncbi:MAG: DUF3817 domain-containing protein, partial [Polyangiales bacterium]